MYPRRDTKKARQTLVLAALTILLGEILAGFMIDRAPLKFRFPEVPRIVRTARMRGYSPEIVFLGGSRFRNLVNAKAVEQELAKATSNGPPFVLNAAVAAGGPETFDFLVTKLLDAAVRPSIAVIEVSPETISRRNFLLPYHLARQFTWGDVVNSLSDVLYSGQVQRLLSTRLIPVYFFRREFRQWAFEASGLEFLTCCPIDKIKRPQTRAPADANMTSAERFVKGTKATRSRLRKFQIGGIAPQALERLLKRYHALGITTILVGVPISSLARTAYASKIDAAYHAYMQNLGEKYGVLFVDYRDRVPDELFWTGYYTTPKGALYVSRLLAREVLAPLWRNRSAGNGNINSRIDVTPPSDAEGDLPLQAGEDSEE
jgi:hypothetical protein